MVKKFRNTKARKRETKEFEKLWKKTLNRVYYRRGKYETDFKPLLPIQSKTEIKNLSTKQIQDTNKKLKKITEKDSKFWQTTSFERVNVPTQKVNEMRKLEKELENIQREIDSKNSNKDFIIGKDIQSDLSVLEKKLMTKPNPTLTGNVKPYDFNKAKSLKDIDSALQVRRNRLDPEWIKEKQTIMQTNFINSLILLFNDEADDVVEMLKQVPADDFYDMYEQFESLDFSYIPSNKNTPDESESENLGVVRDILQSYLDGDVDTSVKVFN